MSKACQHEHRCRYTHGYFCEDCRKFFLKASPVYRRTELLDDIWNVLHNLNVDRLRKGAHPIKAARLLRDRIGIGNDHPDYEDLIAKAELLMKRYGVTAESATMVLK